nr:hypothetical protein [uncultured bacterium]
MTEAELIAQVLEARGKTEQQLPRFRILGVVKLAREALADQIASSGDRQLRELLRKTFGTVTSNDEGVADLTPMLTDAEPLLLKHFDSAEIYLAGNRRRLTLLPDESAVREDRIPGFPFGALAGKNLLVFVDNAPFEGDVSIRAAYSPALANIPAQSTLGERFVAITGALATQEQPSVSRTQTQEMKTVIAEGK